MEERRRMNIQLKGERKKKTKKSWTWTKFYGWEELR